MRNLSSFITDSRSLDGMGMVNAGAKIMNRKGFTALFDAESGEVAIVPVGGARATLEKGNAPNNGDPYEQVAEGSEAWERRKAENAQQMNHARGKFEPQNSASAREKPKNSEKLTETMNVPSVAKPANRSMPTGDKATMVAYRRYIQDQRTQQDRAQAIAASMKEKSNAYWSKQKGVHAIRRLGA